MPRDLKVGYRGMQFLFEKIKEAYSSKRRSHIELKYLTAKNFNISNVYNLHNIM
ncbi:hypothetical protein IX318_000119 [Porphyromonas levii]|nr:hypothetical protein [Porphyromonas levii]MBR8714284.1 hypothetical protein [Porphyromonas levii]MBR8726825.1 hypothetical protein [Porphyromonas levii]MBR8735132.1 hypothetical protein [Porphyromonas levii]MBR8777233.1 hypothetical protein [Porphyromonas levii]